MDKMSNKYNYQFAQDFPSYKISFSYPSPMTLTLSDCYNAVADYYNIAKETNDISEKILNNMTPYSGSKIPIPFRKGRVCYNSQQKEVLEELFKRTKYPTLEERANVAERIGVPPLKVKIWFKNRRAKSRQQLNEETSSSEEKNVNWPVTTYVPKISPDSGISTPPPSPPFFPEQIFPHKTALPTTFNCPLPELPTENYFYLSRNQPAFDQSVTPSSNFVQNFNYCGLLKDEYDKNYVIVSQQENDMNFLKL